MAFSIELNEIIYCCMELFIHLIGQLRICLHYLMVDDGSDDTIQLLKKSFLAWLVRDIEVLLKLKIKQFYKNEIVDVR